MYNWGMYTINKEKEQALVVHVIETREYHLLTSDGLEFAVRIQDYWDFVEYYTDLSLDGQTSGNPFRLMDAMEEVDSSILEYMSDIEEHLYEE